MFLLRLVDILLSIFLIVIFFPLILSISILILIIDGYPIFFIAERVGMNQKFFFMYKFRTMKNLGKKFTDNQRITKLGVLLRRLSLDEIPQIFNVFLGDMSFVGPRPLPLKLEKKIKFKKNKILRSTIRPGITGLSQINYKGKKRNLETKILYDIKFIKNYSPYLYFIIICKTFAVLITRYMHNTKGKSL